MCTAGPESGEDPEQNKSLSPRGERRGEAGRDGVEVWEPDECVRGKLSDSVMPGTRRGHGKKGALFRNNNSCRLILVSVCSNIHYSAAFYSETILPGKKYALHSTNGEVQH